MFRSNAPCAVAALLALSLAACAGSQKYEPLPDPPQPETRATLSGPLCDASGCRCRSAADEAGEPPPDFKRFEFQLGPTSNEFWVTVDDMVLYKTKQRAESCFYLDLRPGEHRVTLRASGEEGFGARVAVSEQGAEGPWWYDTFEFSCGAPGRCDKDTLDAWKKRTDQLGSKHDPCGSTKISGVTWQTGKMPDLRHPSDILLELTLDVYRFTPENPPGADECAAGDSA